MGVTEEEHGINGLLELTQSVTWVLYKTILYAVCVCESMLLAVIPFGIGWVLSVLFYSWIYVFNCLFIKWARFKWSVTRSLAEFRVRAVYYLGLGLPFSLLCRSFSPLANVVLFCTLYPVYEIIIISADDGSKKSPEPLPVFKVAQWVVERVFDLLAVLKGYLLKVIAKAKEVQELVKSKMAFRVKVE